MDTDLQLQGSRGSVRFPCDKALSKAHSLTAERFTGNDILTQIYPQMYTLYKTTFKFFQLSMNVTFKTVIYALKKTSVSHPLLLLSGNTLERLEKGKLKNILFLKVVSQAHHFSVWWQYRYIQPNIWKVIAQSPPNGVWLEPSLKES